MIKIWRYKDPISVLSQTFLYSSLFIPLVAAEGATVEWLDSEYERSL